MDGDTLSPREYSRHDVVMLLTMFVKTYKNLIYILIITIQNYNIINKSLHSYVFLYLWTARAAILKCKILTLSEGHNKIAVFEQQKRVI